MRRSGRGGERQGRGEYIGLRSRAGHVCREVVLNVWFEDQEAVRALMCAEMHAASSLASPIWKQIGITSGDSGECIDVNRG